MELLKDDGSVRNKVINIFIEYENKKRDLLSYYHNKIQEVPEAKDVAVCINKIFDLKQQIETSEDLRFKMIMLFDKGGEK